MPERCEFRISGDDQWLLTVGEESPYLKPDASNRSRQRQTFLTDLVSGDTWLAEPDADVQKRIAEGLGPDGLGCFSPDQARLYFRTSDWSQLSGREQEPADERPETSEMPESSPQSGPAAGISVARRQATAYHYVVDLTEKPFVIRETDQMECMERPDAVKPDIEVRQVSDKRIEIRSGDGRTLATHQPRSWLSKRIGIWELDDLWDTNQWESDYSLSPNGNHLAYRISETDLLGFQAPTAGYMLNLSQQGSQGATLLAASVYDMDWDSKGNFYACTSHTEHRRVIVRWAPGF